MNKSNIEATVYHLPAHQKAFRLMIKCLYSDKEKTNGNRLNLLSEKK